MGQGEGGYRGDKETVDYGRQQQIVARETEGGVRNNPEGHCTAPSWEEEDPSLADAQKRPEGKKAYLSPGERLFFGEGGS